jgi:hypothetical protein
MTTSEWIAGIALDAARLLASDKIDPGTATRIGAATQEALIILREGKSVKGIENEKMLTRADRV